MDYYQDDMETVPLLHEEEFSTVGEDKEEPDLVEMARRAYWEMLEAELTIGSRLLVNIKRKDIIEFLSE